MWERMNTGLGRISTENPSLRIMTTEEANVARVATIEGGRGEDVRSFVRRQKALDSNNNKLGSKKWSTPEACAAVSATLEAIRLQPQGKKEDLAKIADEMYAKEVQNLVMDGQWVTKDGFPPDESIAKRKNVWTRSMEWRREVARSILPIFSSLTEEGEPSAGKSRGQVLEEVRQAYFSAWSLKTSRYSGKTCPPLWCPVEWAVFKRFGPWGPKSHPLFGEDALEMEDMDGVEVTRHRKKRREHFKLPDLEKSTRTIESGDGIHGLEGMSSRSNIQQNHMRELIEATKRQASVQESIFLLNALSTGLITDADTKVLVNQHLTHAVDEILQNEENRAKIARNSSRKDGRRGGTSISTIPLGELMDS